MNLKTGLTLATALTTMVLLSGCNKGGGDVAVVNNEPITQQEFYDYLETKSSMVVDPKQVSQNVLQQALSTMANGGEVNMPLPAGQTPGLQALRDLITRKITIQMAKGEGFEIDNKKIDAEINFQKELNETFVKLLQSNKGLSMDQIRKQIGFELAQQYLITKGITVSDKDVTDFIDANKQQFVEPAEASMLWIVVSSEAKKKEADAELAKGTRFREAALKVSEDPDRDTRQAAFPISRVSALPANLQAVVEKTEVNGTTDWIKDGTNQYKLHMVSKKKEKAIEITDARKEQVRRSLALQRGNEGKDMNKKLMEKLLESKIEVKKSGLDGMWKTYFESVEKQAKQLEAGTN